jgi:hypothetical protein
MLGSFRRHPVFLIRDLTARLVHQHRQGMIDIFFGRLLEHYGASLELVVWLGHKRGMGQA